MSEAHQTFLSEKDKKYSAIKSSFMVGVRLAKLVPGMLISDYINLIMNLKHPQSEQGEIITQNRLINAQKVSSPLSLVKVKYCW